MPISLIIGPPNSGRAPAIRERLEAALDRDPVLVVPTGDEAARFERDLARGGAVLGVSIRTFASLFDEVARLVGLRLPPLLGEPQRRALVRAAIGAAPPRLLARSAEHAGFVPALDSLIAELQAALLPPAELESIAGELDDGGYERELAMLYGAYEELRHAAGRSDAGSRAAATLAALAGRGEAWGDRPTLVYGFDDFSRAQTELLAALGEQTEVTIAVTYGDREALAALAPLASKLQHELGATVGAELDHDPGYTTRESLRQLDRELFEPGAAAVPADGGVVLLECAGELGEAEAVCGEVARLVADGVRPDDVVVVARDLGRWGPLIGRTLARFDVPAAVEAFVPLDRTAVGRSLVALCRAAAPGGEPDDLLAHLRADPAMSAGPVDWLERTVRRERLRSAEEAAAAWNTRPRHLAALDAAGTPSARMRVLAEAARDLAEAPHRKLAPVSPGDGGRAPFDPLELRAAAVAAELLEELAGIDALPGCAPPDLGDAAEAIAAARVPLWRGPADGRVRVVDPHRMRAGRASHLFCIGLQEGAFPRRGSQHPLLSDERRAQLGIAALRRRDPEEWERYLFHACVSRPSERLYLSWQSSDDEGAPLARSPFVDEVLDLVGPDPATATKELVRRRGLERLTFAPGEAPSPRELACSLAVAGRDADHAGALDALGVDDAVADVVRAELARIPDPDHRPGPLVNPVVIGELAAREAVSASSLEGWVGCSYRWFVDHELAPQRLDPESDPLRLGTVAHEALHRLYADPPGGAAVPRPGDSGRWAARAAELIDAVAAEQGMRPDEPPDSVALARLRAQIGRFLRDEAEVETELRPRPDLLEAKFGFDDDGPPALELGAMRLRGAIDRIDVGPDGSTALVRDYKTSSRMPGRRQWEKEGKLQLQLYVLAARESLGLDPVGGIYHPLGGRGKDRRPRGIVLRDHPALGDLNLVGGDPCDTDELERGLEEARALAASSAERIGRGDIDRDPLGGSCPRYCTYQAICRIERALGLEDEGSNGEAGRDR
ncbi:MAG TPA: PD-(D/E)XK nuclease family protein [Solirubrobacterales bacterium]|nr:PD-(D/E)XK nuclease family protein [Solirubrobacterales bacterium]